MLPATSVLGPGVLMRRRSLSHTCNAPRDTQCPCAAFAMTPIFEKRVRTPQSTAAQLTAGSSRNRALCAAGTPCSRAVADAGVSPTSAGKPWRLWWRPWEGGRPARDPVALLYGDALASARGFVVEVGSGTVGEELLWQWGGVGWGGVGWGGVGWGGGQGGQAGDDNSAFDMPTLHRRRTLIARVPQYDRVERRLAERVP